MVSCFGNVNFCKFLLDMDSENPESGYKLLQYSAERGHFMQHVFSF